jgi:hypothetical protein
LELRKRDVLNAATRTADILCRAYVFERDGYRCVYCDRQTFLEWSHIITRGMGGGNRFIRWEVGPPGPGNSVALCDSDHRYFTQYPERWRRFIAEKYGPDHWDSLLRMQAAAERRGDRVDVERVIRGFKERQLTAKEMETWRSGAWLG